MSQGNNLGDSGLEFVLGELKQSQASQRESIEALRDVPIKITLLEKSVELLNESYTTMSTKLTVLENTTRVMHDSINKSLEQNEQQSADINTIKTQMEEINLKDHAKIAKRKFLVGLVTVVTTLLSVIFSLIRFGVLQ